MAEFAASLAALKNPDKFFFPPRRLVCESNCVPSEDLVRRGASLTTGPPFVDPLVLDFDEAVRCGRESREPRLSGIFMDPSVEEVRRGILARGSSAFPETLFGSIEALIDLFRRGTGLTKDLASFVEFTTPPLGLLGMVKLRWIGLFAGPDPDWP